MYVVDITGICKIKLESSEDLYSASHALAKLCVKLSVYLQPAHEATDIHQLMLAYLHLLKETSKQ